MAESEEELKRLLMKVKVESEKVGLKLNILQATFQQYMNHEIQMFKLVLEKGEQPEIKLTISLDHKQESFRKPSISALLTMPKPLTVWITINCGKF